MEIIEWPERDADKKACAEIMTRHHPDGVLTLLKNYELIGEDDISIELDPGICDSVRYFVNKYGHDRGWQIWQLYFGEAFGRNFFMPSLD